jgi:hypothetical protein
MTAARQQRKPLKAVGTAFRALLFCGIFVPAAILAAPNDRIVVDPHSGLAISGFDPVAYFVDAKPEAGRSNMELRLDHAVWRFRNEGNRAAFTAHPEIYAPRFGGYDPVAIARGASVPGNPFFWAVAAERLYLFYSAEARTAFLADPGGIVERATHKWPEVARTIAR